MTEKALLRKHIKTQRMGLTAEQGKQYSLKLLSHIQQFFAHLGPQKIGIYFAIQGELDLKDSIAWLREQGHLLCAPLIQKDQLVFSTYTHDTLLKTNQFGILEPANLTEEDFCRGVPPSHAMSMRSMEVTRDRTPSDILIKSTNLDYVLVPLVAFDKNNNRLGMGKGFYDRSFAFKKPGKKPILIGCAYSFQQVNQLATEAHDIPMDFIFVV